MSSIESQDAAFFQMLSQAALGVSEDPAGERRGKLRRNFPAVQAMAPYLNGCLPPKEKLQPVQCHDLSTGGISYFATDWPDYDRLVVALATANQVIYLTAAVVHTKRISPEGDPPLFQIGCRFIGRVQL